MGLSLIPVFRVSWHDAVNEQLWASCVHAPTAIDCSIVEAISKIEGVIDERNLISPAKLGWNRASRTDAGVHAIGNLISCKVRRQCLQ